jgi:hypothetical protein
MLCDTPRTADDHPRERGTGGVQGAAARLDEMLAAHGLTEDELVADFERWRAAKRR